MAVWGSASNDVWVSGYMGELVHWNGTTMTASTAPVRQNLSSLGGNGAGDVWAVGVAGTALHYNGSDVDGE